MPLRVTQFESTPNPHATKCHVDGTIVPAGEPTRSFRTAQAAAVDPLASALFAVPGVVGVLLAGHWLTVNKSPEADWKSVRRGVEDVLARHAG